MVINHLLNGMILQGRGRTQLVGRASEFLILLCEGGELVQLVRHSHLGIPRATFYKPTRKGCKSSMHRPFGLIVASFFATKLPSPWPNVASMLVGEYSPPLKWDMPKIGRSLHRACVLAPEIMSQDMRAEHFHVLGANTGTTLDWWNNFCWPLFSWVYSLFVSGSVVTWDWGLEFSSISSITSPWGAVRLADRKKRHKAEEGQLGLVDFLLWKKSANGYLLVWGPVVWIPGIPLWKGLLLGCTPIRIPKPLNDPNQQAKPLVDFCQRSNTQTPGLVKGEVPPKVNLATSWRIIHLLKKTSNCGVSLSWCFINQAFWASFNSFHETISF